MLHADDFNGNRWSACFEPFVETFLFLLYGHVGMDAQVAYGFHHLRNEKPYLAQGPITNKVCLNFITLSFMVSIP